MTSFPIWDSYFGGIRLDYSGKTAWLFLPNIFLRFKCSLLLRCPRLIVFSSPVRLDTLLEAAPVGEAQLLLGRLHTQPAATHAGALQPSSSRLTLTCRRIRLQAPRLLMRCEPFITGNPTDLEFKCSFSLFPFSEAVLLHSPGQEKYRQRDLCPFGLKLLSIFWA